MGLLLQQLVSGIASGMMIGLLGMALSTVYQGTGVLNFGQGALATASAYIAWHLQQTGWPFWWSFVGSLVVSFALGWLIERVLIRPVADAPELTILVVTAALLLGVTAVVGMIWGYDAQAVSSSFGDHVWHLGDAVVTAQQVGTAAAGLVALVILHLVLHRTSLGLKMRASAMNRKSAAYLGVNTSRMLGIGWGLAAAMGAAAGIFSAPVSQLNPDMMTNALLMTFAALVLGGVGSLGGVMIGGVIVGVSTNLGFTYLPFISGDTADVVPFVVILAILLLRPQGLFGRESGARS